MIITLRAMTDDEYADYRGQTSAHYAAALLEFGALGAEEALRYAERQTDELLPHGVHTRDMLLFVAEHDGDRVGSIWIGLPGSDADHPGAWVYDLQVAAAHQGRGYGRAIMEAGEREMAARGVTEIGLNVFGRNAAAVRLYQSLGYRVTSQQMSKSLTVGERTLY
jgi:ribosomal protein S18 acetylase RimI-like enzyme